MGLKIERNIGRNRERERQLLPRCISTYVQKQTFIEIWNCLHNERAKEREREDVSLKGVMGMG